MEEDVRGERRVRREEPLEIGEMSCRRDRMPILQVRLGEVGPDLEGDCAAGGRPRDGAEKVVQTLKLVLCGEVGVLEDHFLDWGK